MVMFGKSGLSKYDLITGVTSAQIKLSKIVKKGEEVNQIIYVQESCVLLLVNSVLLDKVLFLDLSSKKVEWQMELEDGRSLHSEMYKMGVGYRYFVVIRGWFFDGDLISCTNLIVYSIESGTSFTKYLINPSGRTAHGSSPAARTY